MNNKVLVFVYGSLMKGFHNHRLLQVPNVKFIGQDSIRAKMYTNNWSYPFIVFSKSNKDRVIGEVYEIPVSLVARLDMLEGYRGLKSKYNLYFRKKVTTANKLIAYAYEAGDIRNSPSVFIFHGDWAKAIKDEDRSKYK